MMATKPTASLRDRRLSPSSSPVHHSSATHVARANVKTTISGGVHTSPPAKKAVPKDLKPKAAPSAEPSPRRSSTSAFTAVTAVGTSKTPSAKILAEKAKLPSSPTALQRSLKPSSPVPKPGNSSRLNGGDKGAHNVTRSEKNSPISKAKSTISSTSVKKKEAPFIIASPCPPETLSSDTEAVIASERPEQCRSDCEKVVEALNELNNEDGIKFTSSLIDGENHMEEMSVPPAFDEIPKHPVMTEEVPEKVGVAEAPTTLEKRDAVERRVEPEVKKLRMGGVVASNVAVTPASKKKDAPRSNDVIEETKSKLMGSRRNRVLALVGAFETVISLQEPESQPIQKAPQIQHLLQIQQDKLSFETKKEPLCAVNQEKQDVEEVRNSRQFEEGNANREDQHENGKHHVIGEGEENLIVKEEEEINEPLESNEEREGEMLKEEECELLKEEEVDEALEMREGEM